MILSQRLAPFLLAVAVASSKCAAGVAAFSTIAPPNSGKKAALNLGKKSTAKDVLKELNKTDRLAPYVSNKGTAIVTGGSSGIGVPSVEAFALAGMRVVLACRNTDDGEKVKSSLPSWCQSNVRVQKLDLADLESVKNSAEEILSTEGTFDVLLNNAGVMNIPKREETVDGFEKQFGTNHIGHHAFTRLMLPGIEKSGGRVVTVASSAHNFGDFGSFDDLNYSSGRSYSPWGAYGQSKLANVLFAKGLDDRLKGEEDCDVLSLSLHPGVVATNLWRSTGPSLLQPLLKGIIGDRNIEQGAATSMYACLIEPFAFEGGEYLSDCAIVEPSEKGKDSSGKLRQQLWEQTEEMITKSGYDLPNELMG
eukprot:CAMPEP_0178476174 /NCGR_PEP_ID=MMETSP0696-20121128/3492_1 /TAXON_ID=265572 /ORGANISM="Extubocellulus spinifer, Strain CCMP396" /LENGTH=363 /DNA_ID=CAMNT_0020103471 /DNA_START=34 /DNA_END=1125 /DNA_ORIENTATION=+